MGASAFSGAGNGAVITVSYPPDSPANLARQASTTRTTLGLTWTNGNSNGGQPVLDYRVSYDQGTATWVVL